MRRREGEGEGEGDTRKRQASEVLSYLSHTALLRLGKKSLETRNKKRPTGMRCALASPLPPIGLLIAPVVPCPVVPCNTVPCTMVPIGVPMGMPMGVPMGVPMGMDQLKAVSASKKTRVKSAEPLSAW